MVTQNIEGKTIVGSLTDPITTFQNTLETQRTAAIAHEQLLVFQLTHLENDLAATRKVIDGCDAAIAALNSAITPQKPVSPPSDQTQTYTSTLETETEPVVPSPPETPVPPFLTAERKTA